MIKPKQGIIPAQMVGGDHFHIGRNLNGDFIFTINKESITMSPAQTHDLAVRLLAALGFQMEQVKQQGSDLKGPRLS